MPATARHHRPQPEHRFSFWAPRYTETAWAEFYEHPPLGLVLEAAAFGLFGDHLIVERAFSLIVLGPHALVIALIWRRVQPAALDWLPLLFTLLPVANANANANANAYAVADSEANSVSEATAEAAAHRRGWRSTTTVTIAITPCLVVAILGIAIAAYPPSRHNLAMYFGTHPAAPSPSNPPATDESGFNVPQRVGMR